MEIRLKQGEDLLIEVIVLDNNNNKVDLSTATKIRGSISIKNLVIKKYYESNLESAISGYGTMEIDSVNNYQLNIAVTREQSSLFPIGTMEFTVLIDFPDLTLTNKRVEYTCTLGIVEKGILKSEDLTI
jgi:hypothetical protein